MIDTYTQEETIPCELCKTPTPFLGTKRCNRCWELERRIEADPEIARLILKNLRSSTSDGFGDKDYMPKVNGKFFRCDCGCNVFRKNQKGKFKCNACEAIYSSEPLLVDKK